MLFSLALQVWESENFSETLTQTLQQSDEGFLMKHNLVSTWETISMPKSLHPGKHMKSQNSFKQMLAGLLPRAERTVRVRQAQGESEEEEPGLKLQQVGRTALFLSLPFHKCPEAFLQWNIFANSKNKVIKFDFSSFTIFGHILPTLISFS